MIFVVGVILSSKDSNSGLNENKLDGFLLFLTSAPLNNLKNLFNIYISPSKNKPSVNSMNNPY
jgi:hypothetical protein